MELLGLTIARTKTLESTRVTEFAGRSLGPTQQLALLRANGAADAVMAALVQVRKISWAVLLCVMAVSYEDQFHYLLTVQHMRLVQAILIPIAYDLATVGCMKVIGTSGFKKVAKLAALAVVLLPSGGSLWVNVNASATLFVVVVFVIVVALIPALELVKALADDVDYDYTMGLERRLLEFVSAAAPVQQAAQAVGQARRCPQGCACGRHKKNKATTTATVTRTRKPKAPAPALSAASLSALKGDPGKAVAELDAQHQDAPVSPAIVA